MTPSAPTPRLLSGAPVSEGRLSPRGPSLPGAIFASFMTQAALKPGAETPLIAPADTPPDQGPGAPTQRAPAKSPAPSGPKLRNQPDSLLAPQLVCRLCLPAAGRDRSTCCFRPAFRSHARGW